MNIREDIKAYIDGELSDERAEQVRSAIDADPALREEYEFMSGLSSQIQSSAKSAPVLGYEKTMASVSGGRKWKFRWVEGLAVAAGVVILGAVIFPMFSQAKKSNTRTALLSEQKQKELAAADHGETSVAERFDDGLDFTTGEPIPYEGDLKESADNRLNSRDRLDSSMGDRGLDSLGGLGGFSGENAGGRADRGAQTVTPRGIRKQYPETALPVEILTPVEEGEARLVIKDATLSLKVVNVQEAMDGTTLLVMAAKGFIESSSADEGEKKANGYMILRIPEKEFDDVYLKVKSLGEIKSEHREGDDVTGTVADIDARIKTLTAEEDSYRILLRNAKKIGDILDIKNRISQVRQQIESYVARRRTLSRLAVLATITVRFSTKEKEVVEEPIVEEEDTWFEDTKIASVGVLQGIGKFVAQVGTFLFILVPVWLPMLLLALWFRSRALRPVDAS